MCDFVAASLRCKRCGYLAKTLPTYRVCKTIPELAHRLAVDRATVRISVPPLKIGTVVSQTLSAVGITPDRVKKIIGKDCECDRRKATLDGLGSSLSAAVERGINNIANAVFPAHVEPDDVAAIANALQASPMTNQGLKDGPPPPDSPPPAAQ